MIRFESGWPLWQLWALGVVALAALLPFSLRPRWKSWQIYLPALSALLWIHYELTIMKRFPGPIIHLDWLIVIPLFLVPLVATFVRIGIMNSRAEDERLEGARKRLVDAVRDSTK